MLRSRMYWGGGGGNLFAGKEQPEVLACRGGGHKCRVGVTKGRMSHGLCGI